jgi:hypothetical protein
MMSDNQNILNDYESIFKTQSDLLPTASHIQHPKMEYHALADGVYWEDEGLDDEDHDLENPFRFVIHHRTHLITQYTQTNVLSESVYHLAKKYFPNWIGFKEDRCSYNAALAERIRRIKVVMDWRIERLNFNQS